jgi:hypothetical protein
MTMTNRALATVTMFVAIVLQACGSGSDDLTRAAADYQSLINQGVLECSQGCLPTQRYLSGVSRIKFPKAMAGDVKELIAAAAAAHAADLGTVCPPPLHQSPELCDVANLRQAKERFAAAEAVVRHDLGLPIE